VCPISTPRKRSRPKSCPSPRSSHVSLVSQARAIPGRIPNRRLGKNQTLPELRSLGYRHIPMGLRNRDPRCQRRLVSASHSNTWRRCSTAKLWDCSTERKTSSEASTWSRPETSRHDSTQRISGRRGSASASERSDPAPGLVDVALGADACGASAPAHISVSAGGRPHYSVPLQTPG
jgi:hypothetical protein